MKDTIVLYAAPGIGHVISMVELGKLILRHHHRHFSVAILLTTGVMDNPATSASHLAQTNPSIYFHQLPSVSATPSSPSHSRAAALFEFIRRNAGNVEKALGQISETSNIRALIIDLFCTSALPISQTLGIPTYYFFTSGAAALAAFLHLSSIHEQTTQSFQDLTTTYLHIPGLPKIRASHMPEPTLDRADPAYHDFVYFCSHLPKSNGILVNTFEQLEPVAIKAISDGACLPGGVSTPPVYYLGPLIMNGQGEGKTREGEECLRWLEEQPSRSVVFLCFGSRGSFHREQIKEIAEGLERSGVRFLWVVKNPPLVEKSKQVEELEDVDLDLLLPEGFLERTRDRGLVVKTWVPQTKVLSQEQVGGFVTHCGWNSVLESVVAGVPMVAWPLYAEQHLNRAALVEDMGLAIGVEQREGDGFVSGAELEKRVVELMKSERGSKMRERSLKMRDMALAAWRENGSSITALATLAELWRQG